ncbi:MAG TPA: response regulator transcription factor [Kiritimatiellia bacterium]|nr:response regulator transcription factor [Kiritimatiellia bacterium]
MSEADKARKAARILVVEDHVVVREGLCALINREPDLTVCGETDTVDTALALIEEQKPDLVLADLSLRGGSGLDLIKQARTTQPDLHLLVISMQDEEVYAERCLKAGAEGYIMKHTATEEFLDAIRAVLAGDLYVSRKMNIRLLRKFSRNDPATQPGSDLAGLSDRELEIYQMIGTGMSTQEIARRLGISPKTVSTHRDNIKLKLGLKNGRALVQSAIRWQEQDRA